MEDNRFILTPDTVSYINNEIMEYIGEDYGDPLCWEFVYDSTIKDCSTVECDFDGLMDYDNLEIRFGGTYDKVTLPKKSDGLFSGLGTMWDIVLSNFDWCNVTSLDGMFSESSIENFYMDGINLDNITSAIDTFAFCGDLITANLENLKPNKIKNFNRMFDSCNKIEEIVLPKDGYDSLEDVGEMFWNCTNLHTVNLEILNYLELDIKELYEYIEELPFYSNYALVQNSAEKLSYNYNNIDDILYTVYCMFKNKDVNELKTMNIDIKEIRQEEYIQILNKLRLIQPVNYTTDKISVVETGLNRYTIFINLDKKKYKIDDKKAIDELVEIVINKDDTEYTETLRDVAEIMSIDRGNY